MSRHAPFPSMLILTFASTRTSNQAPLVNWLPWSLLKISGLPWLTKASFKASTQKSASTLFDSRRRLFGRFAKIAKMSEEIKKERIRNRRLQHQAAAAQNQTKTEPEPPLRKHQPFPKNSVDGHTSCRHLGFRGELASITSLSCELNVVGTPCMQAARKESPAFKRLRGFCQRWP